MHLQDSDKYRCLMPINILDRYPAKIRKLKFMSDGYPKSSQIPTEYRPEIYRSPDIDFDIRMYAGYTVSNTSLLKKTGFIT